MKRRKPRSPAKPVSTGPWFSPWLVLALLAVALGVRLYYFLLTRDQPVWWDEAEYLVKARSIALGTPDTGYFIGRPILLSVFMSGLYAIGLGETAIRVAFVAFSLATVWLTYSVGRRLCGELVGLIAALLFSTCYIALFYTTRIMTEIPQLALCLLAVDLLLARRPWRTALAIPVLVLGTLARFPSAILLPILLVHIAVTEGRAALRNRPLLLSFALAALVGLPYLLWARATYGDPLAAWHASQFHIPKLTFWDRLEGVGFYLAWLRSFGWLLLPFLAVGLVVTLRRALLVTVWALTPLLYFGLFLRPLEDRFIILALPPCFIAAAAGLVWVAGRVTTGGRQTALVVAVALVGAWPLASYSDQLIRVKLDTYSGLKDAGAWIRQNSTPETKVMTPSSPQLTYYSERATVTIPKDPKEFTRRLEAGETRYVVLSQYEGNPKWMQKTSPSSLGLQGVVGFPADKPQAIVFTYGARR